MTQFIAFEKGVEVNGQTVLSVVAGSTFKNMAVKYLNEYGIVDPKPDQWYSQQSWLDSFKHIAAHVGPLTLVNIGRKIPENANWPPQVTDIHSALASIDIAYHMNHRLNHQVLFDPSTGAMMEGIGHYGYEKIDEHTVKMICNNPYPCDFDKGIIEAAANKFKSPGAIVKMVHDHPELCRNNGADTCTYIISWK